MIVTGNKDIAKNIAIGARERTVTKEDGTLLTEKLCPIPFHWKAVDPDGNVVSVALANGTTRKTFRNNDYGSMILEEKTRKGFLWLHECPITKGRVPTKGNTKGCVGINGVGRLIKEGHEHKAEGCKHIQAIVAARRAAKAKKHARFYAHYESDEKKLLKYMQQQHAQELKLAKAEPKTEQAKMP